MREKRATLPLLLILLVTLVTFPNISLVRAEEPVYIKADGTVEGTDKLQRVGNIYSFKDNIYVSIIVERENAVIDGSGYLLLGNNTEYGIKLESNGVTVQNMQISGFKYGIYVSLSSNDNVIVNNKISETARGIYVRGTDNNTITANKLSNNGEGICLSATNSVLKNNQMENNSYNFGILPQPRYNDVDTSNTVNGKPIYYWINQHNKTVPSDAGCVILINCTNIKVQSLILTHNKEGLTLINSNSIEIKNCSLSNHKSGIRTRLCSNINITENIFKENGEGLTIWESTDILVNKNLIENNIQRGIEFFDTKEKNFISDNTITNSTTGIEFTASSNNNTITGNTITNCELAILFTTSNYNTLKNNTMLDNNDTFYVEHDHYTDITREIPYLINDVDSSNTINGKPMYYWINQYDKIVPLDAGYVFLMNCTNITVNNLQKVSTILITHTNDSLIRQNSIENSDIGIKIWRSSNNCVVANYLAANKVGLGIYSSINNNVYWNHISNNHQGIYLSGPSGNNIYRNNISNNTSGIYLDWADNHTLYNNNFIDNTRHVYDATETVFPWLKPSSNHHWNQTYPIGGNYWSNFTGVDLKSGENQNLPGSDGIIDTPFELNSNNTDNYPLADPITFFDSGIWEGKQYYVNCISNSTLSDFSFNPEYTQIQFTVKGEVGTSGFCRMPIPKEMLSAKSNWTILVDDTSITPTINENKDNTYLYFTYNHSNSSKTVEIIGTDAIPEFPAWIIAPLLLIATAVIIAYRTNCKNQSVINNNCFNHNKNNYVKIFFTYTKSSL